jgi:lysozyme family protein
MADFDTAVNIVLAHEGGYENSPLDAGGETKFGISQRAYPNLNIKKLTLEQAKDLYKKDYWFANNYDKLKNQFVANKLFDVAVNVGSMVINKAAQQAYNILATALNYTYQLQIDGKFGKNTIDLINEIDGKIVTIYINIIERLMAAYYNKLHRSAFLTGWLNRLFDNDITN